MCIETTVAIYKRAEKLRTGVWWGDLQASDHLNDLGVGGRIILKLV
jgi:hypothetical protein